MQKLNISTETDNVQTFRRLQALVAKVPSTHITLGESALFVQSVLLVKASFAYANREAGVISERAGRAIEGAVQDLGKKRDASLWEAPLLPLIGPLADQAVSGVIAEKVKSYLTEETFQEVVAHVNVGQDALSNVLTARNIAIYQGLESVLEPLTACIKALSEKAQVHRNTVRMKRFALQDGLPGSLGSVFASYARVLERRKDHIQRALREGVSLYLGGKSSGEVREKVVTYLENALKGSVNVQDDALDRPFAGSDLVTQHALLQSLSADIWKIARDLRLLCSGPRGGLGEIMLPAVAPGSSIMPGKVNPVIAEMVLNTVDAVDANQAAIALSMKSGWLESGVLSNVPLRAFLQSCSLLARTVPILTEKCLAGITANADRSRLQAENSLALATVIGPVFGPSAEARVRERAERENISVKQAAILEGVLSEREAERLLDIAQLAGCEKSVPLASGKAEESKEEKL